MILRVGARYQVCDCWKLLSVQPNIPLIGVETYNEMVQQITQSWRGFIIRCERVSKTGQGAWFQGTCFHKNFLKEVTGPELTQHQMQFFNPDGTWETKWVSAGNMEELERLTQAEARGRDYMCLQTDPHPCRDDFYVESNRFSRLELV